MSDKNIQIRVVHSDQEYEDMKYIRRQVFVKEKGIPEEKEFDGNDHSSTHLVAYRDEKPIGTMRIRYFADFVKFERMAVIKGQRDSEISSLIMSAGFKHVSMKGYTRVYGVCKEELLDRWLRNGYARIDSVPPVIQNGMTLQPIIKQLPENKFAVRVTSSPDMINAVEGEWDDAVLILNKKTMQEGLRKMRNKLRSNS